ncbi:MAG: ATP-binding protein [Gemmataceae bacterium]|nr:ATP-binding protein [Gemmataceae bacterium]
MHKRLFFLRVAGPTLLVSLVLFVSCNLAAVYLYRHQVRSAENLADDVDSRRVAFEIETSLKNLATLLRDGSDQVGSLHDRLWELLAEAHDLADKPEETQLLARLETKFARYHQRWQQAAEADPPKRGEAVKAAIAALKEEALPVAQRLRNFNATQIERSEQALRRTIRRTAWGLLAVGSVGAGAGVLLGYALARALRRSIYELSVRIRDAAGKLRQELPAVLVTRDGDIDHLHEQVKGLVGQIESVVEQLQQREREVLRAEQLAAVGQLAAGVAHELRNPLTAVKMLVQTSQDDLKARGMPSEDLQLIEGEIRRLERSLQTFLDFARPPKMERRPLSLAPVIERALALVSGRARKQKVELLFAAPALPVWLEADGEQLQQLLVNLALNALDSMPHGGELRIETERLASGQVEVRVLDTGAGIPETLLPRLFRPFVSGKETGLGLGLVVSRRIAEEHGGQLRAANRPRGGTCLTLRLPLRKPSAAAA